MITQRQLSRNERLRIKRLHYKYHKLLVKPTRCQECNLKKKLEISNISRKYFDRLDDWRYLCSSCHRKYDMTPEWRKKIGEYAKIRVRSKEEIKKLKIARIGRKPALGKRWKLKKRRVCESFGFTGKKHSKKSKIKIRESNIGKHSKSRKRDN